MDVNRDTDSFSVDHFTQNTGDVIERLKASGEPMVLTVEGRPEVVVQDAASYQRLWELVDRAEAVLGIRKGLESMVRGEGLPADEVFARIRAKHNIPQQA